MPSHVGYVIKAKRAIYTANELFGIQFHYENEISGVCIGYTIATFFSKMADDGRCLHNEQKECAAVVCDVEHNWWYKHAKSIPTCVLTR